IPCGTHLVQIHPDQVRREHPDELLDLQGCEPKRLRIADGRSEGRIDAVDVDREVDLVAVDRLQRPVQRGTDASLMDVEDAHIRQTESFEVLPFLPTVRTHADVDDVFDADVVRDPARRAGVRPSVGEVRVAEVEVGVDSDHSDVLRECTHDRRCEAVFTADDDRTLRSAADIARAYLRTTPLSWTRACVGRALRRT